METATITLSTSPSQLAAWTDLEIVTHWPYQTVQQLCQPRQRTRVSDALHGIIGLLFAATVTTSAVQYVDYRRELRRNVSSPIIYTVRRRRGQPLTLREARQLAFDILAATDSRLQQERTAEARFLLTPWED